MSIEQKIPEMSLSDLETLHANAERLSRSGAPKQQAEANRLLPIIAEALAAQRGKSSAAAEEKKAARAQVLADARAKRTAQRKAAKESAKAEKAAAEADEE